MKKISLSTVFLAIFQYLAAANDHHFNLPLLKDGILGIAGEMNARCVMFVRSPTRKYGVVFDLAILTTKSEEIGHGMVGLVHFNEVLKQYYGARKERRFCPRTLFVTVEEEGIIEQIEKISQLIYFRSDMWLYIMKSEISKNHFRNVRALMNAEFFSLSGGTTNNSIYDLKIYQIYGIAEGRDTILEDITSLTSNNKLTMRDGYMMRRGQNFQQHGIKISAMEGWPVASFLYQLGKTRTRTLEGFYADVWYDLEPLMNFTTTIIKRPYDQQPGLRHANGTYTGLLSMAQQREVDVLLYDMTMTPQRLEIVEFVHPIMRSHYQVYFRSRYYQSDWQSILRPLHSNVWFTTLAWIFLGSLVFHWMDNFGSSKRIVEDKFFNHSPIFSAFFFLMQTLCNQGSYLVPKGNALRCLFVTCYLTAGILLPIYSGGLISGLTRRTKFKNFDSLEEILAAKPKLYVFPESADYDFFANSADTTLKSLVPLIVTEKEVPPPQSYYTMLHTMCTNASDDTVVFGVEQTLRVFATELATMDGVWCDSDTLSKPVGTIHLSISFLTNSTYKTFFIYYLMLMREKGLLKRQERRYYAQSPSVVEHPGIEIGIENVLPIFALLAAAIILSLILLTAEILHKKINDKKMNRHIMKNYAWH